MADTARTRPPVRPSVLGWGFFFAEVTRWGREAFTMLKVPRMSMSMTDLKAGEGGGGG